MRPPGERQDKELDDVRGKLAAGVLEARGAIVSGRGQVSDTTENIRHAAETYRLSDLRLKENAPGAATNDVSQSIRGLELAHFTGKRTGNDTSDAMGIAMPPSDAADFVEPLGWNDPLVCGDLHHRIR